MPRIKLNSAAALLDRPAHQGLKKLRTQTMIPATWLDNQLINMSQNALLPKAVFRVHRSEASDQIIF